MTNEAERRSTQECVFCGAWALRDEDGSILWAVTIATDPDCDHELVSGES